jgi:hypothetical protein
MARLLARDTQSSPVYVPPVNSGVNTPPGADWTVDQVARDAVELLEH